jgi:hypothetical protein
MRIRFTVRRLMALVAIAGLELVVAIMVNRRARAWQ